MIIAVIEVEARHRLNIGFRSPCDPHHAGLYKRHKVERRRLAGEHLVWRNLSTICSSSKPGDSVRRRRRGFQPQSIKSTGKRTNRGEIVCREQARGYLTRSVTGFRYGLDAALRDSVLLQRIRCGVLTTYFIIVVERVIFPAVVRSKAGRGTNMTNVRDEMLDLLQTCRPSSIAHTPA